jgi:hypothetical protein
VTDVVARGSRGAGLDRLPAGRRDAGMVLLEAALAIPLLLAIAVASLGVARVAVDEIAAVAAAREAALSAARGATAAEIAAAWPGAEVTLERRAATVIATVRTRTPVIPGWTSAAVQHRAVATAAMEPGLR